MRILIIEDEKEIRDSLKIRLKPEGYITDIASDGEKGLFLAQTNKYDLIILDYILPKMDGRKVCEILRKENQNTPIIMLTIKSELENKVDLLNLGADDYIVKPFSFEELVARIRAVLRRPTEVTDKILIVEDLELNNDSHSVTRNGKEIYLTRKEIALLEYFMKNKGKVLTRNMIMEHVWDMNADPFSNAIESHVVNLRRKLDSGYRSKLIETVQGRGYKMIDK